MVTNAKKLRAWSGHRRLRTALGALAVGCWLLSATSCTTLAMATFRKPEITFRGIEIFSFGLDGASLDLLVDVYNPNSFGFGLDRVTYDLTIESVRWGTGETASPLAVDAQSTTTLRIPLTLDWTQISGLGREVLRRGNVRYGVSGEVTVSTSKKRFQFPYDRSGEFSVFGSESR